MNNFNYNWNLKDGYPAEGIDHHKKKVFGTFICGGGSTMGYKLAGYDHLGGVEFDKQVSEVYKLNHNPKYLYTEDIREFNKRNDLPKELYALDILDGSPPCSTFSIAGSREKAWGKTKKFREGQALQTLDDLVFVYCDTILKLKPKVFVLENVKGIIQGNAKWYSKEIYKKMSENGYSIQVFILNAASMGVPQRRERIFFIGHKKEFNLQKLELKFNEKEILFKDIKNNSLSNKKLSKEELSLWQQRKYIDNNMADTKKRIGLPYTRFNTVYIKDNKVMNTIVANDNAILYSESRKLNKIEYCLGGAYPLDYNFNTMIPSYLIGMSVPPVMTAQIANQIYNQWLSKL